MLSKYLHLKKIFTIMLMQSGISIIAGLFVLFVYFSLNLPSEIKIMDQDIGGQSNSEASKNLKKIYNAKIDKLKLSISIKDVGNYEIPISSICESDIKDFSMQNYYGNNKIVSLFASIPSEFLKSKTEINLPFVVNNKKLEDVITTISKKINREPKDASLDIINSKLVKITSHNGIKVKSNGFKEAIKTALKFDEKLNLKLNPQDSLLFEIIKPNISDSYFQKFNQIKSIVSLNIIKGIDDFSLNKIVNKMDGISIENQFSMLNFLNREKLNNLDDVCIDFTASAVFAALLESGVSPINIQRVTHEETQDYIKPGLDVRISKKDNFDLSVSNTTGDKLMVLTRKEEDKLIVYVIGDKISKSIPKKLEFVEQRVTPTVINLENEELKSGTKKIISPGRDGMKVKVYILDENSDENVEKKEAYDIEYKPVEAIVQVGPNTNWTPNVK